MANKFIPNGDMDFMVMAQRFAGAVGSDPGRFGMRQEDSDALSAAVERYRLALHTARNGASRSASATLCKNEARADAERIIRRLALVARASEKLDSAALVMLDLRVRTGKAKTRSCPQEPPRLRFVRALHEGNGAAPMHELEFRAAGPQRIAKPPGAARLELFVDLVPPDAPIPEWPGANLGDRPWYLRSYTRSPIILAPPIARVPMSVVYWGRWADSTGNVGPFSATAVGWVEGGSHHRLAAPTKGGPKHALLLEDAAGPEAGNRENGYSVAVIDAQYEWFNPQGVALLQPPPDRAGREPRQLEAPPSSEAA